MKARVRWTALAARVVCAGVASAGVAASAQDTPQRVEITGSSIKRTDAETALPVQVLTRQEIIDGALGHDAIVTSRIVDVHVTALRRKLGAKAGAHLQTVRGFGYKLSEEASANEEAHAEPE